MSLYQVMEKENIDSEFNQVAFSDPLFQNLLKNAEQLVDLTF